MSAPNQPICPVHNLHHRRGPCAQARALRQSAPPRNTTQNVRGRGGGGRGRGNDRPPPTTRPPPRTQVQAAPRRQQQPTKPDVSCDITHTIIGAPATTVSFYSLNSTRRTELHPKFIGCVLRSLKIQWLSFASPQEVTGRIWFLVFGSNEEAPTTTTIKAHAKGFSFKAGEDGLTTPPLGLYEKALLAAKQADHHFGGVRVAFLADITHTATTTTTITPAVEATDDTEAVPATVNVVPSTTEVGILKMVANFTYDRHADV